MNNAFAHHYMKIKYLNSKTIDNVTIKYIYTCSVFNIIDKINRICPLYVMFMIKNYYIYFFFKLYWIEKNWWIRWFELYFEFINIFAIVLRHNNQSTFFSMSFCLDQSIFLNYKNNHDCILVVNVKWNFWHNFKIAKRKRSG